MIGTCRTAIGNVGDAFHRLLKDVFEEFRLEPAREPGMLDGLWERAITLSDGDVIVLDDQLGHKTLILQHLFQHVGTVAQVRRSGCSAPIGELAAALRPERFEKPLDQLDFVLLLKKAKKPAEEDSVA